MARYGVYRGIVTTSTDPEGMGRLKAQIPAILGLLESDWAWPAVPNMAGMAELKAGDPVWIAFEAGDPHKPVWFGTWSKVGDVLPDPPPDPNLDPTVFADESYVWMIVSP